MAKRSGAVLLAFSCGVFAAAAVPEQATLQPPGQQEQSPFGAPARGEPRTRLTLTLTHSTFSSFFAENDRKRLFELVHRVREVSASVASHSSGLQRLCA